jgi:hypothetical protein
MRKQTFDKKLAQIKQAHTKQCLKAAAKYFKQSESAGDWAENMALKQKQRAEKSPFELRYKVRAGIFSSSSGNLTFDPISETGHSYRWYQIVKRINGTLVLNSFPYSATTRRHVGQLRDLLDQLGLKYVEFEAPHGLQNLDAMLIQQAYITAKIIVANRYARKPNKKLELQARKHLNRASKLLRMPCYEALHNAIDACENARNARLTRARNQRALAAKLRALPANVIQLHA